MKFIKNKSQFISGVVVGGLLFGAVGAFAAGGQMIEVFYNVKNIKINNVSKMPSESKPFVKDGVTFVPLRFVAEGLGQAVKWDGKTQTVLIGETGEENVTYLGNGITAMNFQTSRGGGYSSIIDGTEYDKGGDGAKKMPKDIAGNEYSDYSTAWSYEDTTIEYPLNGKYKKFKATIGIPYDYRENTTTGKLEISVDGTLFKTIKLEPGKFSENIELDVSHANKMAFKLSDDESGSSKYIVVGIYKGRLTN
ncbi:hypothetical protein Back11_56570 [Paenibacillus baekrokdamisoli]|uniref:Uncharacterized protein n=1 Tax=Paenibacillus baekrokdamisoli TaxID=1712516 RepID=A0A3G9J188_9BACL|nr:stalk domain-containing protein [Paenibacillus baekrokdamisoli]MBB3073181.1 hypothetical protein [Paenibacillus baekrokdamisoli]BBH24312.1 hypothetical protein Back11_56570 [Paenibacillus baekrokdamisoli]